MSNSYFGFADIPVRKDVISKALYMHAIEFEYLNCPSLYKVDLYKVERRKYKVLLRSIKFMIRFSYLLRKNDLFLI
jgi:hypothetical protein